MTSKIVQVTHQNNDKGDKMQHSKLEQFVIRTSFKRDIYTDKVFRGPLLKLRLQEAGNFLN
jgi:hypothetical protein